MTQDMSLRHAGWTALACGPFVMLALVGIAGRTRVDSYQAEEYNAKAEAALLAYAPLVRQESRYPQAKGTPDQARELAGLWLDAWTSRRVEAVGPGSTEDQGHVGIRGRIEESRTRIQSRLWAAYQTDLREGKTDQAAEDLLIMIEFGEIGKYGGAYSVAAGVRPQRVAVERLTQLIPQVSEQSKDRLAKRLDQIVIPESGLDLVTQDLVKLQIAANAREGRGWTPQPIANVMQAVANIGPTEYQALSKPKIAGPDTVNEVLPMMLMAAEGHAVFGSQLAGLRKALTPETSAKP